MDIGLFLRIANGLTGALAQLHARGLIHKNIKPANALVNAATGQVCLTGPSVASRLPRERQSPEPPEFISGTLAYMASEQTGRVNRSVDSRSDLYSLGITFYEMLTGHLPFVASDPMEWVHCQIAKQPPAPASIRRDLPAHIAAITVKLLSKAAEECYQTAAAYDTLAQALQGLIGPLLSKSDDELSQWRDALREALDPNGQLMVGLVPELKAVIGDPAQHSFAIPCEPVREGLL